MPNVSRSFLYFLLGMYYCFRSIALIDEYIQEVESIKRLGSTVGKLDADDRFSLPLLPMLLALGVLAVSLVGVCVAAHDLPAKFAFGKGCVIIDNNIIQNPLPIEDRCCVDI